MTSIADRLAALALSADFAPPLQRYIELFHKWNRHINLSAARSESDLADHVADCLQLIPHLRDAISVERARPAPVLDVGAGGGLPAAIIAICLPDVAVTALEPVHKKHAFLRTVARELALTNLEPLAERLEDHARRDYAAATSRATLDLRDWLLLGVARIAPGGTAFGFEATVRPDLPVSAKRFSYNHLGHQRAIVAIERPIIGAAAPSGS